VCNTTYSITTKVAKAYRNKVVKNLTEYPQICIIQKNINITQKNSTQGHRGLWKKIKIFVSPCLCIEIIMSINGYT